MTRSMLNRFETAQHSMALLTLPKSGVVECDLPNILDIINPAKLTGPEWREAQRVRLERVKH